MPDFVGYVAEASTSDEELLRQARERLVAAKKFRTTNRESHWGRAEDQYEGKHWPQGANEDPAADLIVVNVSFSTVNTIRPFITAEEPRFLVEPYSTDALVSNARLQQAWLNRFWRSRQSRAQSSLVLSVEDELIYGDGYLKVLHEFKEKATAPDTFATVVDLTVNKVSPWDVWIDPNANGIFDARYLFHRIHITREEMEADEERWGGVDLDELQWGNLDWGKEKGSFNQEERFNGENNWMVLFEYYDTVRRISLTFAEAEDSPLLRKVEEVEPPLVQLGNYRLPNSPYHIGELEQIWSIQQELNKSRSELATHRRRNIAKYFARKGVLGQSGIAALQSPIVGEVIEVEGNVPLQDVVAPAQIATLPGEAYASADQALRDVYEITGVNEYLRGATPEIRRTATEASIIEGASNVKVAAKLSAVEVAAREAGTILLAVAEAVFPETDADEMGLFLSGEEAKRAVRAQQGEDAQAAFEANDVAALQDIGAQAQFPEQDVALRPTEDMFLGEYEVFVETHSTELRNPIFKEQKARELAQGLTQMAPGLMQLGVQLNVRPALERWLEAAGVSDIEGFFEAAQPTPLAAGSPLGGVPQEAGQPNLQGAQAPTDAIVPDNSGQLPPA